MPESMNISPRPSIHGDDTQLSSEEESDPELSIDIQNDNQSFSHTKSNSDHETSDRHRRSPSLEFRRRKSSGGSHSFAGTSQSLKQQGISSAPCVPESCRSEPTTIAGKLWYACISVAAVIVVIAVCFKFVSPTKEDTEIKCSFAKLRNIYPEQEPIVWKYLTVGIESILSRRVTSPGVYLFVHQGGERVTKLIRNIASHSARCFDNDTRPVEMESKDFNSDEVVMDYGYAIKIFKEKIQDGNVILIANLNEIPPKAARALHTICDTISPIAPNLVIFLTLTVPGDEGGNVESVTEDALKTLWGQQLESYELDPLITRVTDQVLPLKS